ncbi:protein-S-isoprenylcysteine O-methyltransferase-like [Watersipora subatra]|uniref:protein-S-isoprenylcysteine O-methyltransferase-like n=1 Tax=Watersipora subatra TaxID=2589382 RepID=UPI00355C0634
MVSKQTPSFEYLPNWSLSARCYVLGTLPYIIRISSAFLNYFSLLKEQLLVTPFSVVLLQFLLLVFVKASVRANKFDLSWRALLLGSVLNLGLSLSTFSTQFQTLGIYLITLSFFHWSEYMTQAIFNPDTTGVDNYMLYHSHAYVIAFFTSLIEFTGEMYLWPTMKEANIFTNIGIALVIFAECLRKSAMWTAKSNFNHYVQYRKKEDHQLVCHGVYGLFRHPAYVGFFWWSVGTQFIMLNPVCLVAYTLASWKFFSDRIFEEERTLINFFGNKYIEYQAKVGTGLPYIKGYINPKISKPVTQANN